MEWMYKEHAKHEDSPSDMNTRTSRGDSSSKQEDNNCIVNDESEDRVGEFEDKMSMQTTLLLKEEGDSEDISTIVGPITSDLDELSVKASDSLQPGRENDVDTLLHDSGDVLSLKRQGLGETADTDSGLPIGGLVNMADCCGDMSNQDKTIELLQQEVGIYKKDLFSLQSF